MLPAPLWIGTVTALPLDRHANYAAFGRYALRPFCIGVLATPFWIAVLATPLLTAMLAGPFWIGMLATPFLNQYACCAPAASVC